jgi:hypothetical protein
MDRDQFALDIGADGRIGAQGFKAWRELVAVKVELAGREW